MDKNKPNLVMNRPYYVQFSKDLTITGIEANHEPVDEGTLAELTEILEPKMKAGELLVANKEAVTDKTTVKMDPITLERTETDSTNFLKKITLQGVDNGEVKDGFINAIEWFHEDLVLRIFVRSNDYEPKGKSGHSAEADQLDDGGKKF